MPDITELSEALMTISPSQARKAAERYAALKAAKCVTEDGELLTRIEYDKALDDEHAIVKRFVEQSGPLDLEGIGTFRLQDRSGQWSWDCIAMAENDRATFDRLLALGAITVNKKVADALEQAGQVTGFKGYGHAGSTKALVIDKER